MVKKTADMAARRIEDKYKSMSDIEHVLFRPGMYVGSTKKETVSSFIYNKETNKMELREYSVVPAMLKIVDEIISNSCDEYRRPDNLGLSKVSVSINKKENSVTIKDNGGIAVVKHKDAGCWLPEFIFGRLRTSSNYNDDDDRAGVGTNGVGSSISNIFSSKFIIKTCDGKKKYSRSWSGNMQTLNDDLIIEKASKSEHGTETKMLIDMSRFDCANIDNDFCAAVMTRCANAAAANLGLTVTYADDDTEERVFKFSSLKEYGVSLYNIIKEENLIVSYKDNDKEFIIYPDDNTGTGKSANIGFVNGAECSFGTHVRAIRNEINNCLVSILKKKHKIEVTPRQCDQAYIVFCSFTIANPAYDSQTKDTLTTPVNKFYKEANKQFSIPDSIIKKCCTGEIISAIIDWHKQKESAEDQKALRRMNREAAKGLNRPDKYIDCASKKPGERQLWIFEGDSAKAAFRTCRDPKTQAGLIMRGVPKGAYGAKYADLMKNEVYSDIIKVTGLKLGSPYNKNDIKFSKIVISSDMDNDGHHIAGLLQQFFSMWPGLFDDGVIVRSISPVIIAKKGKDSKCYYNMKEYKKDESKLKGWTVKFAKGLGGLNMEESKQMYLSPRFERYALDDRADDSFGLWFSDDADKRKCALAL